MITALLHYKSIVSLDCYNKTVFIKTDSPDVTGLEI